MRMVERWLELLEAQECFCLAPQDDLHLSIPMNGQHTISPEALRDTTPADITSLYEVSPPSNSAANVARCRFVKCV